MGKEKNSDVDIFIYSHVPFTPLVSKHVYKVLTNSHADDKDFNTGLEIFRDYEGDNISDKNLMYNEYAGFYWIWKNYPLKDYVGMNHYSRYYCYLDKLPNIKEIMTDHSMMLNQPVDFTKWKGRIPEDATKSNEEWYRYWHNINDFNLLKDVIQDLFPEYMDGFEKMAKAPYCYNSSMFVMKKEDFLKYCEFIFPVLEEVCKRRGYNSSEDCVKWVEDHKDEYIHEDRKYYNVNMQARIVGYLAERAMNAYIMHGEESLESKALIVPWFNVPKGQIR